MIFGRIFKIFKPFKVKENVISWEHKFSPMLSKSMNTDIDEDELKNIESYAKKLQGQTPKGTSFKKLRKITNKIQS